MSSKPLSLVHAGTLIGVFALVLSLFPLAASAAGGDAQAAMRPPELAKASPAPDSVPASGTPIVPAVKPELDCLIEPYMSVELATSVSGIVKVVNVDRGNLIRTGQVLAQLEAEVEKANVARERARAEFAAKKYHRMRELYKEQMVSAQQMEEAKADSELAAAELRKAVEMLNQRTVYAPFNGVVVDRFVSPGELVESKKVLKVAQINPLSVEVIVPISMLGEFKLGGKVRVAPEGPMAGPYEARVKLVDRVVDAASGSFRVRLALPNPKHQISAGVRCKAQIMAPVVDTAKAKKPPRTASKAKATKLPAEKPKAAEPAVAKTDAPTAPGAGNSASTAGEAVQAVPSAAVTDKSVDAANLASGGASAVPVASTGTVAATGSSAADRSATVGVPPESAAASKAEAHESAPASGHDAGSVGAAASSAAMAVSTPATTTQDPQSLRQDLPTSESGPAPETQADVPGTPTPEPSVSSVAVTVTVPEAAPVAALPGTGLPPAAVPLAAAAADTTAPGSGDASAVVEPAAETPTGGVGSTPNPDRGASAPIPGPEKAEAAAPEGQKPGAANGVPSAAVEAGAQL